jgi:hypothetical protein
MNEAAYFTIQSKVQVLDRELFKYLGELMSGQSLTSDEHLKIMIDSTERELATYDYILKLIINNGNKN